jgi:hypothetical protein
MRLPASAATAAELLHLEINHPPRTALDADHHPRRLFGSLDTELEAVEACSEHRADTGNKAHHRHDPANTKEQHRAACS